MKKKIIFLIAFVFIPLILFGCDDPATKKDIGDEEKILFYGDGCPHCTVVDEYIEENDIETKIDYHHLEVWNDKGNADLLTDRAEKCGLDTERIGVPFFWDGEKCYIGDVDIKDYFESQINEDNSEEDPEPQSEESEEE